MLLPLITTVSTERERERDEVMGKHVCVLRDLMKAAVVDVCISLRTWTGDGAN